MVLSALIDTIVRFVIWTVVAGAFGYYALLMAGWTHDQIMDLYNSVLGLVRGNAPPPARPARAAPAPAPTATDADSSTAAQPEGLDMTPEEEADIMKEVLESYLTKAEQYRADLGDKRMTVEHMVLAMAEDARFGEIISVAEGLDQESLKKAIRKSRVVYNRGGASDEPVDSVLAKYSRDLTALALEGKLDPVIGRNDEIRRLIDVLTRRTKSSGVLLGEAGVGKTAIVEGLAQRCADEDVPEGLRGCRVIALEMGMLMAGATFPGEFEERIRGVLKELVALGQKAILFIDDIHGITGPNAQQGGGVMDASLMLKPLLSRGEIRCIGCTSQDKYRKFIEKDPGLERRFQQIAVDPPTVAETMSILRGLRHKYEKHHDVRITDAALAAAAQLSDRYMPDRYLPDKAIDLIDEAAAKVKSDIVLKPEALDRAERRIRQLEAERKVLQRTADLDPAVAADLEALESELVELKEAVAAMAQRLEVESRESECTQRLQDEIDALTSEIEAAEAAGEAAKADDLRKARREQLLRKLRLRTRQMRQKSSSSGGAGGGMKMSRAEVGEPDVARVISKWTGIPLTKLVESEASKLLQLTDELHKRIIGQHEAVVAVAEAIQRSRAGMKDPNGPIASFLFLGPTGVGKTELAKALAANLFDTDEAMVRLDMSEYMEKHAVAKLIGAPPGYLGYDEGGQLTEQVRRRPYCVVLFDEVEKAHVDVFNLLLQLLDDGRVTDSQGRLVSFKNAIIIMTSNLGSADIYKYTCQKSRRGTSLEELHEMVMDKVRKHFQPEFLNRIDEFILFEPLVAEQIETIVRMRTHGVGVRLGEKKMRLELRDGGIKHLAGVGFDPVYGARPVKRAVQRELETPLAKALLSGLFQEEDTVVVDAGPQGLTFSRIPAPVEDHALTDGEADSLLSEGDAEWEPLEATTTTNTTSSRSSSNGTGPNPSKKAGGSTSSSSSKQGMKVRNPTAAAAAGGGGGDAAARQEIPVQIPGFSAPRGKGRGLSSAAAAPPPTASSSKQVYHNNAPTSTSGSSSKQVGLGTGGFNPLPPRPGGKASRKGANGTTSSGGSSSNDGAESSGGNVQGLGNEADAVVDGGEAESGAESDLPALEGEEELRGAPAAAADGGAGDEFDEQQLPASFRTPRRRDEQDTLPTCTL